MGYYKYEDEAHEAEDRVAELEAERELLLAIKTAKMQGGLPSQHCACDICQAIRAHDAWLVERAKESCPGCFPGKPCYQHKPKPLVGTVTLPGYTLLVEAPAEPVSYTQRRLLYIKPYPTWARGDKVTVGGLGKRWDGPYQVLGIRDGELQIQMTLPAAEGNS